MSPTSMPANVARQYAAEERRERRLKAVPKPEPFSAGRALRRAGLLAPKLGRELADDAARGAGAIADRQPFNLGAAGGMLVAFAAGLAGLIFLDLVLSDRASRTYAGLVSKQGPILRALRAFADPTDPIFARTPRGAVPPAAAGGGGGGPKVISAPTPGAPSSSLFRPASGEWGGAKSVADRFAQIAIGAGGLAVSSTKRDTRNTASGGVSDHWTGSTTSYAYDLSGTVERMDRAAAALMAALGIAWDGGAIVQNVTRFGYRLQVIYRTNVGGNHFDHIHIGVRRV